MEFFTQIQYISIHLSWAIVVVGESWVHELLGAPKKYYSWEDWDQLEIYKRSIDEVMIVCKTSFLRIA